MGTQLVGPLKVHIMKLKLLKENFSSLPTKDEIKKINDWLRYHLPSYASYANVEEAEKLDENTIKVFVRYSIPDSEDDYQMHIFKVLPNGEIEGGHDESLEEAIINGNFGFTNKKISQNELLNELNKSKNIIGDKESRYVAVAMKDSIARHSYEKVLFTNDLEEAKTFVDENSWFRDGDWNYGLPIRYFSVIYDLIDEYPKIIYPENGEKFPSWDKKDYTKYTVDENISTSGKNELKLTESLEDGISAALRDLINQENDLLNQYESAQVTLEDNGETRFNDIFDYIKDDINIHIGMLQSALEDVNPPTEKIDDGKDQGEQLILDEAKNPITGKQTNQKKIVRK